MLSEIIFILGSSQPSYTRMLKSDIMKLAASFGAQGVRVSCLFADIDKAQVGRLTASAKEQESKLSVSTKEQASKLSVSTKEQVGKLPASTKEQASQSSGEKANNGILYITDDAGVLERMIESGHYVIALSHDYNSRADLQKASFVFREVAEIDFDSFQKAYERLAGLPWHILDTMRLRLRETTVEDIEDFYRIYSDPFITRHIDPLYLNIEEEKAYAKEYIRTVYGFYGYGVWTVLLQATGEVIGRAGISWREGFKYPELGFVIARGHQRQGYAEEILRAIIDLARTELDIDTLQSLVRPGNEASIALCRKLGFDYLEETEIGGVKHLVFVLSVNSNSRNDEISSFQ